MTSGRYIQREYVFQGRAFAGWALAGAASVAPGIGSISRSLQRVGVSWSLQRVGVSAANAANRVAIARESSDVR